MRRSKSLLLGSLSALALLLSCVDGTEPISPAGSGNVRIPLSAQVLASAADASALPINRIRAVARAVPGGQVLGEATVSVDPTAASWEVPLELTIDGLLTEVIVEIALVHVDAAGAESIQYSGRIGPITVRPGHDAAAVEVPVVRGPPGNLAATAIDITNATPALIEGGARTLQATVTTTPPGAATTAFWTSLSPTLLTFNGAVATAVLPGTARVIATAGPVSDTADVQILQRPAAVAVTPASTTVELGTEVVFTAAVLDPRGAAIAGQAVLWRSLDPTVLESLGTGRFRTVGSGAARAEARAAADTTLKAAGTVRVTRRAVDIAVTKTTPTTQAFVGDAVVYTVAAANLGDVEAAGVTVRDQLPAGLTLESSLASAGTFNAATGTWSVGNLAAGARATLELRTRLTTGAAGTVVSNTAEKVASDLQADPNTANDRATATFSIGERTVDISVQKTASRGVVLEGDTVTFIVTVANSGPGTVTNLAVADTLPAGMTIVSDQASRGNFARDLKSWAVGSLAAGESAQLTIVMRASAGTGGTTQTNVARTLAFDGPRDSNPANNRAAAAVTIQSPNQTDLAVTKTAALSTRQPGDTAVFTVKVKNIGALAASAVEVKDSLSSGLAYVSSTTTAGTFSATTMVWTVTSLVPGDSAILTVRTVVGAGTTGTTQTNTARYLVTGPIGDSNAGNNIATASVTIPAPTADVEVVKVVDVSAPFELTPIRFTITASNLGPNAVTNLRIKDKLPAGLTLDSVRTANGTVAGDTLWTIASLPVSSSAVMFIYARVNDLTGGTTIVNQAQRLGMDQSDPVTGNDNGSATVNVQKRKLDISVLKTASVAQPTVLSAFSYKVTVKNRGPGNATGVQVADTLPTQLTVDSVRTTSGAFASSSWSIASLAPGDSAMMTVYVRVPQAASGQTITNRAYRAAQAQLDTNGVNDISTVSQTIPVNNPPVVTITAPPNQAVFDPGDTITFTATADDQEDGPLTTSISWRSNVSGAMGTGGTVTRFNLAPGPHLVIAQVTDSNNNISADTVPIVIAIVTTPTSLNVPFGGTASLPISLSAPAPSGGLVLTISSADTTKVKAVTTTVTIPAGALSANATLSGVQPGSAVVTASTNGFGSSSTNVSVTAALNIVQGSVSFPQGYTGPFTVRLESQGVQIAAPAGGISVTLTSANPACVAVTSPVTIPAGQVSVTATATYGGTATTPCNTTITAAATSITSDALTAYVNTPPALTVYTNTVGSGLMTNGSVQLDYAQHGGVTVRVQSLSPALALVSPNNTTAGTAFVDVFVPNGQGSFTYYLHGLESVTGNAVIQATTPTFSQDTTSAVVQQPAVTLAALSTSGYTSLNADQPFYAMVGISDIYYGGVNVQTVRPGGSGVTVTISSSDTTKAALVKTAVTDDTVTVTIPAGQYLSPTTVATGGVALDFRAAGTTTVSASIPGFIQRPGAVVAVSITAPGIQTYAALVGGGLQISSQAYLGSGNTGGVNVTLTSSNPAVALLSPNATTAGTTTLNVNVPNGNTYIPFYVQGVETAVTTVDTARAVIRISAPGFVPDSAAVTVVRPNVALYNLGSTYTTFDNNVPFYAAVGTSDFYYGGVSAQSVRAGGPTLTVTFTSSDSSKAALVTTAKTTDTVTAQIPPGLYYTPFSVAAGGVALDPRAGGSATIKATIPGFVQRPAATVAVTVNAPTIDVYPINVGAGLQTGTSSYLGAPAPSGGVTLTLVSSNPSVALLSPNATTAGTSSLTLTVPQSQSSISYFVQGIAGTTGNSIITVSAPGFTTDTASASITQPYVTLYNLSSSTTTLSANQAFYAAVGLSDLYYGGVSGQVVRAGGSPLTVTIASNQVGVGQLQTTGGTSGTATVTIPVGQYLSPTTVAAGGVAFDPVGAGSTTVSASIPGFLQRPGANVAVTVSSPGITMSSLTVGSGLMAQGSTFLGAPDHGGVTLRIKSSSGAIAKVSANNTTAGTDSVDVFVPNGTQSVQFWVHGMEGQTGTVQFTAAAAGFTDGSAAQMIVQPAVGIQSMVTSIQASAADRLFYVYIGTPSGSGVSSQVRRAGGAALVATVTSSAPAVGTLVTSAGTGGSRTVNIAAGQYLTPGSIGAGGIAFDPLTTGSTTLNATIPGFIAQPVATVNVNVTP